MPQPDVLGPFRPGFGGVPPHLAGRKGEQRLLRRYGAAVADGAAPATAIVLYGPRGNGKTALLGWLEDEAARAFPDAEVLHFTPAGIGSVAQLSERIAPRFWLERVRSAEVQIPVVAATIRWGLDGGPLPPPDTVLEARVRSRPLVMMMDEAHTLDPEVGRALLAASQLVSRRHPFLLVLAGTPDLPERLQQMGASFWARARQLRIGRLDAAATAEAIRTPLASRGVAIGDDLLDAIVEECHGYPFFIQAWGDAVWRQAADEGSGELSARVTPGHHTAARARFEAQRDAFYLLRYREIADGRLLPAARAVADAFSSASATVSDERLHVVIGRALGQPPDSKPVVAARRRLDHLGYIWGTERRPEWEPGIPSLMEYMRRYAPPLPGTPTLTE